MRQGRREPSYQNDTGASEDAASRRPARPGGSAPLSPSPPGPRTLLAVGLALAGLLGLVAVASRAGLGAEGGTSSAPLASELVSYFYVLVLVFGVVAVPLVLYVHAVETKRSPKRRRGRRLLPLTFVLLAGLVFLVVTQLHDRISDLLGQLGLIDGETLDEARRDASFEPPAPAWVQVAVASSVAFAATGIVLAGRKLGRLRHRDPVAKRLAAILDGSLDELRDEADPRRAVIRAYARMERDLQHCGVPRHAAEAPLEYLGRVLDELDVPTEPAHALTDLFERARFSQHAIDSEMKDEAVTSLEAVRRHLRELA